jgi:hypothetical protein
MRRITHANGVVTYTFDLLADLPVQAHVAARHGGVSPEPWHSLNFSIRRGDAPERVQENRRRLAAAVGTKAEEFVHCEQVHGTGVAVVGRPDAGTFKDGCDALVTDAVGLPLALVFGDCVPVVLYDPAHHALGVCHAGWRGTVNDPAAVRAGIGPSIGPESYEVGDEVVLLAQTKLRDAGRFLHYPAGDAGRPHFDLWRANQAQLVEAGVAPANIEISALDTARTTGEFFSHRAERGRCGLFAMVAWLVPAGQDGRDR